MSIFIEFHNLLQKAEAVYTLASNGAH